MLGFIRVPLTLVWLVTVNGGPGLVVRDGGGVLTVMSFTIDRGRITALDAIRAPVTSSTPGKRGGPGGTAGGADRNPVTPGTLTKETCAGNERRAGPYRRAP